MSVSQTKSPTDATPLELPRSPTDPRWIEIAMGDLDAVLCDHLHCERKAAQSALSLLRNYPEHPELIAAVSRLAHEETSHVVQVGQLLRKRGIEPRYDVGDDYAHALRKHIRKNNPERLLDSLIVFALIEARSAERLALLAGALPDPDTASLYRALATAEVRHRDTFLRLAANVVDQRSIAPATFQARVDELAEAESTIIAELPIRPRIH